MTASPGPADPAPQTEPSAHDEHPATSGYGRPADDACSVLWDRDGTSAFGTAATARFFVIVEQPGPWGRDVARESHLDPALGAELDARCAGAGGRFMLMRHPKAHPDEPTGRHRVLVAYAAERGDEAWLLGAELASAAALLDLDWTALAEGDRDAVTRSLPGSAPAAPTLLVCTNGRRDVCCAVRGRPLAAAAHRVAPGRTWEVSHTGGHRFAPTAVLLPWGQTYARLDESGAAAVLAASLTGHTPTELLGPRHDRGRSGLPGPAQCAESFVREAIGETRLGALSCAAPVPLSDTEGQFTVTVTHDDGRTWVVQVGKAATGLQRPESCGKAAVPIAAYRATLLTPPG